MGKEPTVQTLLFKKQYEMVSSQSVYNQTSNVYHTETSKLLPHKGPFSSFLFCF